MKSIFLASVLSSTTAYFGDEPQWPYFDRQACGGMVSGAVKAIDTYQQMSFSSVEVAQDVCVSWCTDYWENLPQVPHCCWYGMGKVSGFGFEIC